MIELKDKCSPMKKIQANLFEEAQIGEAYINIFGHRLNSMLIYNTSRASKHYILCILDNFTEGNSYTTCPTLTCDININTRKTIS